MSWMVAGAAVALAAACTGTRAGTERSEPPADVAATATSESPRADIGQAGALPDPATVELPDPVDRTGTWLEDDGSKLVEALAASAPLATLDTETDPLATCEAVARNLDAVDRPSRLFQVAADVPDPDGATILINDLTAKSDLLASCGSDSGPPASAIVEVRFTHTVAVRWAAQYGIDADA